MANLQKYGAYDLDTVDEEDRVHAKTGKRMKIKVGKNVVRFLPPLPGQKSPFHSCHMHFINVPGVPYPISFLCPRLEVKKPCPACTESDRLKTTGNPADHSRGKAMAARKQVFANVIDREDEEVGVKIYQFGTLVFNDLRDLRKNEDWGGDYTHPQTGFDIVIKRSGSTQFDTEYKVSPCKPSPLGNDEWIDQQYDFDKLLVVPTPEQMRASVADAKRDAGEGPTKNEGETTASRRAARKDVVDAELTNSSHSSPSGDDDVPF